MQNDINQHRDCCKKRGISKIFEFLGSDVAPSTLFLAGVILACIIIPTLIFTGADERLKMFCVQLFNISDSARNEHKNSEFDNGDECYDSKLTRGNGSIGSSGNYCENTKKYGLGCNKHIPDVLSPCSLVVSVPPPLFGTSILNRLVVCWDSISISFVDRNSFIFTLFWFGVDVETEIQDTILVNCSEIPTTSISRKTGD